MADVPFNSNAKVTVERRGQIVLIGINRPYIHNRIDPETYAGLAQAYYQYEHDPRYVRQSCSDTETISPGALMSTHSGTCDI
jgi:hypothetical protein